MLQKLKRQLGYIQRGAVGIIRNYTDRPAVGTAAQDIKSSIGTSVQGRAIEMYTIGTGSIPVLIVGGIHGNEVGSIKASCRIINWLTHDTTTYPNLTFYVIPCLNPDGYAQAQRHPDYWHGGLVGRFNGRNVDLNRNFNTPSFQTQSVWSRGKNYSETIMVQCGANPLSEPETQTLVNLITQKQITIYVALHNAAADVMGSNNALGEDLARIFSQQSGYQLVTHENWEILRQTGTAKEWCDSNNITYLEIEGRDRWSSDWTAHRAGLAAVFARINKLPL